MANANLHDATKVCSELVTVAIVQGSGFCLNTDKVDSHSFRALFAVVCQKVVTLKPLLSLSCTRMPFLDFSFDSLERMALCLTGSDVIQKSIKNIAN